MLLYAQCRAPDATRQLETAERWLVSHSHDAALLYTLGRLCERQQLWGKAQTYLEASLALDNHWRAHVALGIRAEVNGVELQSSSTAQMVFGVAELIASISRTMTLDPGDVIATGTPPGVGFARTPPVWLRDGDEVTIEIERIGRLTNPVRTSPA